MAILLNYLNPRNEYTPYLEIYWNYLKPFYFINEFNYNNIVPVPSGVIIASLSYSNTTYPLSSITGNDFYYKKLIYLNPKSF